MTEKEKFNLIHFSNFQHLKSIVSSAGAHSMYTYVCTGGHSFRSMESYFLPPGNNWYHFSTQRKRNLFGGDIERANLHRAGNNVSGNPPHSDVGYPCRPTMHQTVIAS